METRCVRAQALGLISQIDRAALAAYCSAWAEVVTCERKIKALNAEDAGGSAGLVSVTPSGYEQMSVWVQIRNRAYDRMMKFAAEFGLSPSARSRVTASKIIRSSDCRTNRVQVGEHCERPRFRLYYLDAAITYCASVLSGKSPPTSG